MAEVTPDSASAAPESAVLSKSLLAQLRSHACSDNVAGMARFGISAQNTLGVSMPVVRGLARDAKRALRTDDATRHDLAHRLWGSGVHEARILAALVEVPSLMTVDQADDWAADLDSWDVCDQLCLNTLRRTAFAWELPGRWASRPEPFVKRAGFVTAATLAVHEKSAGAGAFEPFLTLCERECTDERNEVRKGVNWALRQIGKRDATCNALAIATAERILAAHPDSRAARWIARDALRELRGEAVASRLGLGAS